MHKVLSYAAQHAVSDLRAIEIQRPEPGPDQLDIAIDYCGDPRQEARRVARGEGRPLRSMR